MPEEEKSAKATEAALSTAEDKRPAGAEEEDEVLEGFPEGLPKEVRKSVQMSMMAIGASRGSAANELSKKIGSEHISAYLETSREEMHEHYKERKQQKLFLGFLVIVSLIFFVIVIGMLKDSPELLEKVIIAVAGFVGGAAGGYGFGKSHRDDD